MIRLRRGAYRPTGNRPGPVVGNDRLIRLFARGGADGRSGQRRRGERKRDPPIEESGTNPGSLTRTHVSGRRQLRDLHAVGPAGVIVELKSMPPRMRLRALSN